MNALDEKIEEDKIKNAKLNMFDKAKGFNTMADIILNLIQNTIKHGCENKYVGIVRGEPDRHGFYIEPIIESEFKKFFRETNNIRLRVSISIYNNKDGKIDVVIKYAGDYYRYSSFDVKTTFDITEIVKEVPNFIFFKKYKIDSDKVISGILESNKKGINDYMDRVNHIWDTMLKNIK